MTQRDGNILSQVIRDAWDCAPLETMTKQNPLKAPSSLISIIGHITKAELTRLLSSTEIANGLGNRFIFIKSSRDKKLPNPDELTSEEKEFMVEHLKAMINHAKSINKMEFSSDAKTYWGELYLSLNSEDSSIVGTLTARQEAQIRRLAMIISLFNGKDSINLDSLIFAEKIFNYSIETLKEIYGHSMGDPLTDKILDLLKSSPDGLSRSKLHEYLSRNYQKGSLDNSLKLLKSQGLAECEKINTQGRPIEVWKYKIKLE